MEYIDRIKNINQNYKIGLLLLGALIIGFAVTSVQDMQSFSNTGSAQTEDLAMSRGIADSSMPGPGQGSGIDPDSSDRKIVTTVRTTLKVDDVASAQEKTRSIVEDYNGFIESSSIDKRNEVSGRMTVAIPAENLSSFRNGLESNYRVESENTDRSDVTDRYNELESELESKKQEMRQLEDLMNRSESVSDLVEIQERMSELRSRIDYLQKQLDNLDERVDYSTVHITFEGPELLKASFDIQETFFDAYRAIFESIRLMIIGAAYLLPFAAIIGLYKVVKGRFRP